MTIQDKISTEISENLKDIISGHISQGTMRYFVYLSKNMSLYTTECSFRDKLSKEVLPFLKFNRSNVIQSSILMANDEIISYNISFKHVNRNFVSHNKRDSIVNGFQTHYDNGTLDPEGLMALNKMRSISTMSGEFVHGINTKTARYVDIPKVSEYVFDELKVSVMEQVNYINLERI